MYDISPGRTVIPVECPRACGYDGVEVVRVDAASVFLTPASCEGCDATFSDAERATLEAHAKDTFDNYGGPSDHELEMSRGYAFPTIAERLDAARRLK